MTATDIEVITAHEFEIPCEYAMHNTEIQPIDAPAAWIVWLAREKKCGCIVKDNYLLVCDPCWQGYKCQQQVRCPACRTVGHPFDNILRVERLRT